MELRYLHYFIAIAEELSFSRAAERLNISQPPLSQQIQRMEAEIGVQLLSRTKRSVKLTAAGEAFLRKAYKAIDEVDGAIEEAKRAERGYIGTLSVGFVPSSSLGFLPLTIREFRGKYPDVAIRLLDLMTGEQVQLFAENKLDVGFVRPPIEDAALRRAPVIREQYIAVLPKSHPLAERRIISPKDLRFDSFLVVPHALAPGMYNQVLDICSQAGFHPSIYQEIGQMDIILNFVAAELGIALLPRSIMVFHHEGVVYRPLESVNVYAEVTAIWKEKTPSPILANFLSIAMKTAEKFLS